MIVESYLIHMSKKDENEESQVLREMFEEIMKMIREKQVSVEAIIQSMIEQDKMSLDTFNRIYSVLTEHGKKKRWV